MIYNESTFMIVFIIGTSVGAIIGATIYYFIGYKFSSDTEKQIEKNILNYEKFVLNCANNNINKFESLKEHFISISSEIISKQADIYKTMEELEEELMVYSENLKSNEKIRASLENEIVKLKNILNRKIKKEK